MKNYIKAAAFAVALLSSSSSFAACVTTVSTDICNGGPTNAHNVGIGDIDPTSRLAINGAASAYDSVNGGQISFYGDSRTGVGASGEVEAVNHGTPGTKYPLYLNGWGGAVNIGSAGSATSVKGTLTVVGNVTAPNLVALDHMVFNETVFGTMDSTNKTFDLLYVPLNGSGGVPSVRLMLNGQVLDGNGNDYSISANVITMVVAPAATDKLRADYLR